jgi:nitrate reductase gamma subunit
MNAFQSYLHTFFFSAYPYICMVVFLVGSLARFDRDQYTWKSDSSHPVFVFRPHGGPADTALDV